MSQESPFVDVGTSVSLTNVDQLFSQLPTLFPNPVPSIEDRTTILVGERVKVLVGIREDEQLVKGRWVIVESIRTTESGQSWFVGRYVESCIGSLDIEFGPEHVYRIEPRLFTLWGFEGAPRALRGQDSSDKDFHLPVDRDGRTLSDCTEVILRFRANGFSEAKQHYEELARTYPSWPTLDALD